jgi:hypothetical protein
VRVESSVMCAGPCARGHVHEWKALLGARLSGPQIPTLRSIDKGGGCGCRGMCVRACARCVPLTANTELMEYASTKRSCPQLSAPTARIPVVHDVDRQAPIAPCADEQRPTTSRQHPSLLAAVAVASSGPAR